LIDFLFAQSSLTVFSVAVEEIPEVPPPVEAVIKEEKEKSKSKEKDPESPEKAHDEETSPSSSPSTSPQHAHRSSTKGPPSTVIVHPSKARVESRRHSGKTTQGAKGAERIKVFMEGDDEPVRVWVEPAQTTTTLIHELSSKHYAERVRCRVRSCVASSWTYVTSQGPYDELSQLSLFYVNEQSGDESQLGDMDLPYRIYTAHKKSHISIHFIFK